MQKNVKSILRSLRARPCTVFFRDDDVDELSGKLIDFAHVFLSEKLPINYQVVPGKLQDDACEFILEKRRGYPELIRLNQHGYMHEYVKNGVHTWGEYSGNRPYQDQYQSIQCGQRILREKLGKYFDSRVFTPPAHKYDENTLRALEALGFDILSASSYTSRAARLYYGIGKLLGRGSLLGKRISYSGQQLPGRQLREVSVALDVDMTTGNPVLKTTSRLVAEFERARSASPVVGIVFHHNYLNPRKLQTLREFVRVLRSTPGLKFRLIEDIADDPTVF